MLRVKKLTLYIYRNPTLLISVVIDFGALNPKSYDLLFLIVQYTGRSRAEEQE